MAQVVFVILADLTEGEVKQIPKQVGEFLRRSYPAVRIAVSDGILRSETVNSLDLSDLDEALAENKNED